MKQFAPSVAQLHQRRDDVPENFSELLGHEQQLSCGWTTELLYDDNGDVADTGKVQKSKDRGLGKLAGRFETVFLFGNNGEWQRLHGSLILV